MNTRTVSHLAGIAALVALAGCGHAVSTPGAASAVAVICPRPVVLPGDPWLLGHLGQRPVVTGLPGCSASIAASTMTRIQIPGVGPVFAAGAALSSLEKVFRL